MDRRTALLLAFSAAACSVPPQILPPPFGEDTRPRLFYPTGIASTAGGDLVVANGDFDHSYDAATIVTLRRGLFAAQFAQKLDCGRPLADGGADPEHAKYAPGCDFDIPPEQFAGAAMIGNYSGPLALDSRAISHPAGYEGVAYTGSRDSNRLNRVLVRSDGSLSCPASPNGDCRPDEIDLLASATLEGPYAIAPGFARIPGETADRQVVFVSSLVPHIDRLTNGVAYTSSTVAALDAADPTIVRFSMLGSSEFIGQGVGIGPMVFDDTRRQLFLSGCFQRAGASAAGDPATARCTGFTNSLRVLDVDSVAAAAVRFYDLTTTVHSVETIALALDTAPTGDRTLWATTRNADALLQLDVPATGGSSPAVRHATPLPLSPSDVKIIPRPAPATTNLVAVAAAKLGSVMIYDPSLDSVVAVVERLGDTPWKLELLNGAPPGTAWLAASVFGNCRVAMIEVPLDRPWDAALRGRAGVCP